MIFWKEWKGSTATRISWSELTALFSSAACCDPEVAVLSDLDLPVEIVPKNGNFDQLQQENQEGVRVSRQGSQVPQHPGDLRTVASRGFPFSKRREPRGFSGRPCRGEVIDFEGAAPDAPR